MSARPAAPQTALRADDEVAKILAKRATHAATGLSFDPATTYDEWSQCLPFYFGLRDKSKFWLGDAIIFGATHFSDKYSQAIEMTGRTRHDLVNIVAVCERIPPSRRREALSFEHHAAVAYDIPYQEADRLLIEAEKKNWNRDDIRDAVCRLRGKPTRAEREQAKAPKTPPTLTIEMQVTPANQAEAAPKTASTAAPQKAPQAEPTLDKAETSEDALTIAESRIHHFNEAIAKIDPKNLTPIQRKRWLKLLAPVDEFIDALTK